MTQRLWIRGGNWEKIVVAERDSVSAIDIALGKEEGIPEGILELLPSFHNLETLRISGGVLYHFPGRVLAQLTSVKQLWIESCHLKAIPEEIVALQSLEELFVSRNDLERLPGKIL